jgi:hypothetical protein
MDALGVRHLFTAPNFGGFSTDYCNPENLEQSWRDRAEFVRIAARKLTEQQSGKGEVGVTAQSACARTCICCFCALFAYGSSSCCPALLPCALLL